MYDLYKPFRNNLRKFSVVPALFAAFRFMQFLDNDIPLPAELRGPSLLGREDRFRLGILQWEFELLIREIVLHADPHGKKHVQSWSDVARLINGIKRIENGAWGHHDGHEDDILYELVRIAHRQFPWQRGITKSHFARYHKLYSNTGLSKIINQAYGMTTTELFQIALSLSGHYLKNFSVKLPINNQINNVPQEICTSFISKFSISFSDLKKQYQRLASYDVNWTYTFNPLRKTPLIYFPESNSIICPIPNFLIRRITNELYFDLVSDEDAFSQHYGPAVQSMIGEVARIANSNNSYSIIAEERYGTKKSPRDTVDWILSDSTAHLFVECKGARVKFRGISDLRSREFIEAEFTRIKSFALQLYKTLHAALNGEYPNWQPDNKPVYPIIVTLEDWQTFGLHIQRLVFDPLKDELVAIGIDPSIIGKHPLSFASIEDFEIAMQVADSIGIDEIFRQKAQGEYPQWSLGVFVSQKFPKILSQKTREAFVEEWQNIVPVSA